MKSGHQWPGAVPCTLYEGKMNLVAGAGKKHPTFARLGRRRPSVARSLVYELMVIAFDL